MLAWAPTSSVWLVLFSLCLSGCQMARQARCARANGNVEACQEMSSECWVTGGPRCEGGAQCPGSYCRPDAATSACTLSSDWRRACPRDRRIFSDGTVGDLEKYPWPKKRLSPAAARLSGKHLTREDFASITEEDRKEICQVYPGEKCTLTWDEAQRMAVCDLPPDPKGPCSGCTYARVEVKCEAKNLCTGVICL